MIIRYCSLLSRSFQRIEVALSRPWCKATLLLICILYYCILYLGQGALPGNWEAYPRGWWGWWDQSQYLGSSMSIADFNLNRDNNWGPLGYPLIGAIFVKIMPVHAFFIPNLLCFLGIVIVFYMICRVYLSRTESILVIFLVALLTQRVLVMSLVVPWNTIPVNLIFYIVMWFLIFTRPTTGKVLWASLLAGLCFWCKPIELLPLIPILIAGCLYLKTPKKVLMTGFLGASIIALFIMIVVSTNYMVFKNYLSRYDENALGVGLGNFNLLLKSYILLFDGQVIFRESIPVIVYWFPWLLLVPPGLWLICKRIGVLSLGFLGALIVSILLYFSYNDLFPTNIFRFNLIHYLYWTIPLLFLAAYLTVRSAWSQLPRYVFIILLIPLLLIFSFVYISEDIVNSNITQTPNSSVTWTRGQAADTGNQYFVFDNIDNNSMAQVIYIHSVTEPGELSVNGILQKRFKDYTYGGYGGGTVYLLARPISVKEITLKLAKPLSSTDNIKADVIQLNWRFGLSPAVGRLFQYNAHN